MCGLVGIFDTQGRRPIDRGLLDRMNERQHHRGPDEGGLHVEPGLGLGHRRLSIIDLATGQQPLFNEDGSVVVVFNGEIYNFGDLVKELKALGHTFRTHSDTEVIVHAWEAWGERCVERFRGMFAFALWDRNRETLFLARDRFGVKPLNYAILPDGLLLFGSELKAFDVHDGVDRRIDPVAVEQYFALGYVPEPRTVYRGIRKLEPGHFLTIARGQPSRAPTRYWDIPFRPAPDGDERSLGLELVERLREAIRIRLISEVPLGAFLSGGVDSSAVVAMMAQVSTEPVNTCSIAFGEADFDESEYARRVAERYGTHHAVDRVDPDDCSLVGRLAEVYDEPFADSSALPTYRVCELARRHVTVALSGDGGDENFGGYRRYQWYRQEERQRSALPLALRRLIFGGLARAYPRLAWAPRPLRARATFRALSEDGVQAYFRINALMPDDVRWPLYSREFMRELQGYSAVEVLRGHAAAAPVDDPVSLAQYLDMKTYLPGDILTKVDRASMAHALEVREPLLDHELMEWVSGIPAALKLRGETGKYLFKKALEPYLPEDILYRPKRGFAVPLAAWFRGPLREQVRSALLGERLVASGVFAPGRLARLFDEHQSGRLDHSAPLWSLLMFDSFLAQRANG